jgi:hypothetical protein
MAVKKVKKIIVDKYELYLAKAVEIFGKYMKAKIEAEEREKIVKKIMALGIFGIIVLATAVYFALKK